MGLEPLSQPQYTCLYLKEKKRLKVDTLVAIL